MNQNVGTSERAIRLLVAIILVSLALFAPMTFYVKLALYVVAAIAVVTAAFGYCPLWTLFGVNTCGRR
jgi:hypothetical protein